MRLYGRLTNLAGAPVDVHPWLVPGWSLFNVMGWDDLRLRPLAREDLLERHRFGREAFSTRGCSFRKWWWPSVQRILWCVYFLSFSVC